MINERPPRERSQQPDALVIQHFSSTSGTTDISSSVFPDATSLEFLIQEPAALSPPLFSAPPLHSFYDDPELNEPPPSSFTWNYPSLRSITPDHTTAADLSMSIHSDDLLHLRQPIWEDFDTTGPISGRPPPAPAPSDTKEDQAKRPKDTFNSNNSDYADPHRTDNPRKRRKLDTGAPSTTGQGGPVDDDLPTIEGDDLDGRYPSQYLFDT